MDQTLNQFGWAFTIVMLLCIIVPYVRGRSDLITGWNFFLLGSARFVGISSILSATQGYHYEDYTHDDYMRFMVGVILFYSVTFLVFYTCKPAQILAGRTLRKWPSMNIGVLYLAIPVAVLLSFGQIFPPPIQIVGQLCFFLGNKALVIAVVLAFVAWYRQKVNPVLLATLVGVLAFSLVMSLAYGTGRRSLMSVVLAIPVCLYWLHFRHKDPVRNLVLIGIAGLILTFAVGGYSGVRAREEGTNPGLSFAFESLQKIRTSSFQKSLRLMFHGNCTEASLLSIHLYTRDRETYPFHSFLFVVTNPIPRAWWPDKPVGFGHILPRGYAGSQSTTWGAGIVGHAYYEGGMHFLVFYGILWAAFLRYFDELVLRQGDNPYVLALLAASCSHITGWCRGELGTFMIHIIAVFLTVILFGWLGRLILGTGLTYPRNDSMSTRWVRDMTRRLGLRMSYREIFKTAETMRRRQRMMR